MACIVPSPEVTDLTEVYSNKKDFNRKDHDESNISKDIQKFNDKEVAYSQKDDESVEENLRDVVCDVILSNGGNCNQKKLGNDKTPIILNNKIHLSDGIDLNELSKDNELRANDKKYCNTDNYNNTAENMLKRSSNLMDSESVKETSLYEILNKNSAADNVNNSESSEHLQITECKNISKNKSLRRIIDSESEEDIQTSDSNNLPQMIHNTVKSYQALIDSESEEGKQNEETENNLITSEETSENKNASLRRIIDSESEEDTQTSDCNNFPQTIHNTAKSYQALIDSESEEEKQNEKTESNLITSEETSENKNASLRRIIDSESEEDTQKSDGNNFPQTIHTTAKSYQALIDSETEEETENNLIISEETSGSKDVKKKSVKKRKGSIRASKDEAMRQIHSETQRLLRETEISLPYHRPKQRTLQEFLNRKKIAALPNVSSTAAKLKMSSVIVSQVLAEKEKEAELFYKSSDSEDDMQQSMVFISKDIKKAPITNEREKMFSTDIDHICIQNPKEIEKSTHTQDSQDNNKEIIQKDHLDLNASKCKVLLEKVFGEVDHQAELVSLTDNLDNGSVCDTLPRQITNENNKNLPKLYLPRKLFDTCSENESNVSEISLDEQEATKEVIETINPLNKEKCINDEKKAKITILEDRILKISNLHQYYSEVINGRDKNLVTMKISEAPNSINNKEITETFQSDNDLSDNVTYLNSDDCIIEQDRNNEKKDNCSKTNDVSSPSLILINDTQSKDQDTSTDECEKSDGHVQGLPLPEFADETLSNKKKILSTLVSNSKITLKGSPGMIIDLTDNTKSNVKGVNTLLERFFCKHVNTKKQTDNKPEVTVIHLEDTHNGPLPIKEVLPYKVPINTDNSELNKPGAKLMRLKEDLKLQMILKRNKEWKQKEIELQAQEKEEWNEEEESDYDLDGQEKAELGFELSDSEESEPEENDICIQDKERSKCLFADDEAEVTDNEDSSTEETFNESDTYHVKHRKQSTSFKYRKEYMNDNVSEIETDQEEENDEDEGEEKEEENEESLDANIYMENRNEFDFKNDDNVNMRKSFDIAKNKSDRKTIQLIEEFEDNSNITNPSRLQNDNNQLNMTADTDTSKTRREDNDWISENESNIPACQQYAEVGTRSQICKTPLTKTSMLDLVSPITQLSVLNVTLDSNKKDSPEKRECLVDKHEFISMESIQSDESSEHVYNIRNKTILKKKLFDDIGETIDDEYLMRLCSGKFESTQRTDLDLFSQSNTTESQLHPSESELCPGNSNANLDDVNQLENPKVNHQTVQDMKLMLDEESNNSLNYSRERNKVSAMDPELKLRIVSSDDEDEEDTFVKPRKRSAKRLNLSDSEEENSQFSDEEDDNVDNKKAEKQYVDYDSEENEVMVVPKKDIKKVAADFLEEEAELSESDWDSADEDEKDLDKLEFEEADDEHIDEHEVKDELEKIHMKQILDEDKREVRLLKELLFEDGDLHTDGMGRERKFKWRNIDKLGNNIETPQISDENDGWVDVQEDEEEAKWSKLRHERDKFLEEKMKCLNNEIEDELYDSQIFKLGLKAVRKIKDNESQKQDTSLDKVDPSENMEPIMPRNITDLLNRPNIGKKSQTIYNIIKKRSLLTRGEESLARIASLAKQSDSASHAINTRNFVFPHIDQSTDTLKKENKIIEDLDSQIKPGKRKMMSNMSSTSKKRRK